MVGGSLHLHSLCGHLIHTRPHSYYASFLFFELLAKEGLTERINERVAAADIPIAGVYRWGLEESSNTANAFVGMGKTRRIILSDTLLKRCDEDEILAVVAHEIGHCKHQDIWRMMGLCALCVACIFWSAPFVKPVNRSSVTQIADVSAAPLLLFSICPLDATGACGSVFSSM